MEKKHELLAPIGNFAMLNAAINAGTDAVYFGIKEFNMRSSARNFSIEELKKVKEICNQPQKKVKKYLTLNVIIYDDEIKKIEKIIKIISKKNLVDAIICWDLSVINLCKKYKIPFHISTQASISNTEAAKFYKKIGAERIVLARELSLEQIKKIHKEVPNLEIESFCHGAMCVAVSGRCFMSQFLWNKSANRGECLQACRRTYKTLQIEDEEKNKLKLENNRVMSAKDLCTLPLIEKMKKAGIKSFKIEGRGRDARYVDVVVKEYRKALDKKITKKDIKEGMERLKEVYNRKFSKGFFLNKPSARDFSDVENSAATTKKHYLGKITHYYPKMNVATIKLVSQTKERDIISIIGNTTGIKNYKIQGMEIEKKKIKKAEKGQEVGIKIPCRVRKNDEVYKIIKNKK